MAANLQELVDKLSTLTVIEAAELSKMLEEKWGVSAAAPVAIAAAPAAGGGAAAAAEEQTVKAGVSKDEAAQLKAKLEAEGAVIEVK